MDAKGRRDEPLSGQKLLLVPSLQEVFSNNLQVLRKGFETLYTAAIPNGEKKSKKYSSIVFYSQFISIQSERNYIWKLHCDI